MPRVESYLGLTKSREQPESVISVHSVSALMFSVQSACMIQNKANIMLIPKYLFLFKSVVFCMANSFCFLLRCLDKKKCINLYTYTYTFQSSNSAPASILAFFFIGAFFFLKIDAFFGTGAVNAGACGTDCFNGGKGLR